MEISYSSHKSNASKTICLLNIVNFRLEYKDWITLYCSLILIYCVELQGNMT